MSSTAPQNTQPQAGPAPIIINNVTPAPRKMRHGLHLFLTIVTLGAWAPVWLILAIAHRG